MTSYRTIRVDGLTIFYREAGPKDAPGAVRLHVRPHRLGDGPLTESFGLSHYTPYMQDYGGSVGVRMALAHPERVQALIVQDAVAHNDGLGRTWRPRRAFWADGAASEATFRAGFLSFATTRTRHVGDDPNPENYDPDLWTDELAFLSRPGSADIQIELFYDYRTNVDAYPQWQAWMRKTQPRLRSSGGSTTYRSTLASRNAIARMCRPRRSTCSTRDISRSIPEPTGSPRSCAGS